MSLVLTVCNKAHKCAKLKKKTLSIIRKYVIFIRHFIRSMIHIIHLILSLP